MFSTTPAKASTFLFVLAVCQLFTKTVTCAPAPIPNPNPDITDEINNSYSGAGGRTSGGGVTTNSPNPNLLLGGMGLLDVASGNGGQGGLAKSGPAAAGSGPVSIASPGSSTVTDPNGSASSSGSTRHSVGNAYSGAGGIAEGGSVTNNPSLIKLFSGNGGKAGDASSGPSGPVRVLLSGLRLGSTKSNSSPRRGGRTRVARFYKINLD